MIYKFMCKVAGDLFFTGPAGDQMLRIIGKAPAASGIIGAATLPAAIRALGNAVARDVAGRLLAESPLPGRHMPFDNDGDNDDDVDDGVTLRQRVWPLVDMMKRALDEDESILWTAGAERPSSLGPAPVLPSP